MSTYYKGRIRRIKFSENDYMQHSLLQNCLKESKTYILTKECS